MVNQQIKDYVAAQMKAGIGKEDIKKALLDAGWYEAEINEAMQASGAASAPAVTKDIVQPKVEEFFKPAASREPRVTSGLAAPASAISHRHIAIVFGAVALLFAVLGGVYYFRSARLDRETVSLSTENAELENLNKQIGTLVEEKEAMIRDAEAMQNKLADAESQLAILLPGKTGAEDFVSVKGTLGVDRRGAYTITTPRGLVVTIKNGKDEKIEAILKEIIDAVITISGPHIGGTKEVTLTAINGMPAGAAAEVPAPSSSAPVAQ